MPNAHKLPDEEVNPIDDVRNRFNDFYTGGYYRDPLNGDWWSDDYWRIIDLTTQGAALSDKETGKLERAILRFNERSPKVGAWLGSASLLGAYNSVAEQINTINASDPTRSDIPHMLPAPYVEPVSHEAMFAQLVEAIREK